MRDLYADLALCERATPGPWEARKQSDGWWVRKLPNDIAVAEIYTEYDGGDAIFIAESREGWSHVIRRAIEAEKKAERLRREIERLRKALYAVYALVLDAEADEVADIIVDALGGFELMERYQEHAVRGEEMYREISDVDER